MQGEKVPQLPGQVRQAPGPRPCPAPHSPPLCPQSHLSTPTVQAPALPTRTTLSRPLSMWAAQNLRDRGCPRD